MTFTVAWDNDEKTVIRYETYGHWTTQEFWEAMETGREMLSTVEHRVHFILIAMDKLSEGHIPNGFLSHIGAAYRNIPSNAGVTVSVPLPRNTMAQMIERIVRRMFPQIVKNFEFADTLEEARAILQQRIEQENPLA